MKNCSAQQVHFSVAMSSGPLFIACGCILSHRHILSSLVFFIAVVERSNASRKCLEAMRISEVFGLLNRHDCAHTSLENTISYKLLISFIFRLLIQPSPTLLVGKDWSGNKKKPESSLHYLLGLRRLVSSGHGGRLCQVLSPIRD